MSHSLQWTAMNTYSFLLRKVREHNELTGADVCSVLARGLAGLSQKQIGPGPSHGLVPSSGHLASGFNFHEQNWVFIDELQEISSFRHCHCLWFCEPDWSSWLEKYGHRRPTSPPFKDGVALLSSALSSFLPEGDANVTCLGLDISWWVDVFPSWFLDQFRFPWSWHSIRECDLERAGPCGHCWFTTQVSYYLLMLDLCRSLWCDGDGPFSTYPQEM